MFKKLLMLTLAFSTYVHVIVAGIAWFNSDPVFTARYLAFLASPVGVSISATLFATMTLFIFAQAMVITRRPRHMRWLTTTADQVAWVIIPAWKGVAILLAFGVSYYGTPAGV